jgi:hypothetical protein
MKQVRNSEQLQQWLLESGYLGHLWDHARFTFDPVEFDQELTGVRLQYPHLSEEHAEARAALRLLGKEHARRIAAAAGHNGGLTRKERILTAIVVALLAALLLLLGAVKARAEEKRSPAETQRARGKTEDQPGPAALLVKVEPDDGAETTAASRRSRDAGFRSALLEPQGQPGGLILQVANQGTVLATRPAGMLQFNCSTGMSCSFAGTVFTLTGSGGGSTPWSGITNPGGNLALTMGAFTSTFTFNAATGAGVHLFSLTDTTNNTGTGALFRATTASGSGALPIQFDANGNGLKMTTAGLLTKVGTGALDYSSLANFPSACGTNNWATQIAAAPGCSQPGFSNLSGSIALGQTPLTTRGDVLTVNSTPALARLTLGANNLYLKSNGSDLVYSTNGAAAPITCTNQVVTALAADAAGTCSTVTHSFVDVRYALAGGSSASVNPAALTTYCSPPSGFTWQTTVTDERCQLLVPYAGTVVSLYAHSTFTGGSAGTVTMTLLKNGATCNLTFTWTMNGNSPQSGNDTSHTCAVVAGDRVALQIATPNWGAAPTAAFLLWSVAVQTD